MEINIDLNAIGINAISGIVGTIIGSIVTYITCFSRAKKEQRAKIIGKNMEKRNEALEEIRKVINKLTIIERADIVHPNEYINRPMAYQAIFENYNSFEKFRNGYNEMRKKYDQFIDGKLFYYILAGTQYLMFFSQTIYVGLKKDKEAVYTVGLYVYKEVNEWEHKVNQIINNELNNPRYKYKKKIGWRYQKKLNKLTKKVKDTILYKEFIIKMELNDDKLSNKFQKKDIKELYKLEMIKE